MLNGLFELVVCDTEMRVVGKLRVQPSDVVEVDLRAPSRLKGAGGGVHQRSLSRCVATSTASRCMSSASSHVEHRVWYSSSPMPKIIVSKSIGGPLPKL